MKDPVLELSGVSVELGGESILTDVNMRIFEHDTIVIIGPSGSGKSVLLKTMAGIYQPVAGHVLCYGQEWSKLSMTEKHETAKKVGVQFQKSALFDDLSAYENVAFPLREHLQMTEAEIEKRVLECLRAVDLERARDMASYQMSGGMQLRLGIARAIALKPPILFLDDPTAGLDPVNSDNIAGMMFNFKTRRIFNARGGHP